MTYPDHAADMALCKAHHTDIQSGDTYDISLAPQQATGTVSPKPARDVQAVLNVTTVNQDLKAQVNATLDCALVKGGLPPEG